MLTLAASNTVVTAPVNWTALLISLGTFIASMGVIFGFIDRRQDKRETKAQLELQGIRIEFKNAMDNLAIILSERLETKDNVNVLRIEIAKMSEQMKLFIHQNP